MFQADADGASEISDLAKLYDRIQEVSVDMPRLGGTVGVAIGSR